MRTCTVYREVNGETVKEEIQPRTGTPVEVNFEKRMQRSYYDLECSQGSRFRSQHTKEQIKQAWW